MGLMEMEGLTVLATERGTLALTAERSTEENIIFSGFRQLVGRNLLNYRFNFVRLKIVPRACTAHFLERWSVDFPGRRLNGNF